MHPNATVAQLKNIPARSADDDGRVGVDELYGHGFVNAGKAVQRSFGVRRLRPPHAGLLV